MDRRQGTVERAVTIDSLPLSNRTLSRLREAGIVSAEELAARTDDDLLALRGFGHTCLREVRAALRVQPPNAGVPAVPFDDSSFPGDLAETLLALPLRHLPISNRARGVFAREGIETVADYVHAGARRLLELRNLGATTLAAVNRVINAAQRMLAQGGGAGAQPFPAPELVGVDLRLDPRLSQVPVAALDLPRRARRACQDLGLRTLRDLTRVSANELLVRRNFGQATLRRIQGEMERFLHGQTGNWPEDFAGTLEQILGRLQPKERRLVELREGRDRDQPHTLTEAGAAMEITESRACQIEHSAWAKLRRFSAGITDPAADNAVAVLMRHGGVADPAVLQDSPFFAQGGLRPGFVARMLARLLPHRLARLADGRLAAVPAATLCTLAARLRKRLRRSTESLSLRALTSEVLRGLDLGEERLALVRALCEALFGREVAAGPDGEVLVRTQCQGLGDDLRQILLAEGKALHFSEVAQRLALPPLLRLGLSEEKVRLRLCRDRRFVLVRRGLYDLRERFSVQASLKTALADAALQLLKDSGRPTSVALLGAALRARSQFAGVSEFVLAAVLREDERFAHLGRGTFAPAGSRATAVQHVSEILESILSAAGGPLSYSELKRRVQERRQVSDGAISATLVGRGTFLRVARGMFDLAERYPFDGAARERIARQARERIAAAGGVMPLDLLAEHLDGCAPGLAAPPAAILIGDLLRRTGGFEFLGSGYVGLAGSDLSESLARRALDVLLREGEPLRPTAIARRLSLDQGAVALLRKILRSDRRFLTRPEGRFSPAPS
ncbi:MAG: hypothetical protein HY812_08520 [Planctomycetes bacterium]|nr:hypothetical protein [Planctomycetota bacterium]